MKYKFAPAFISNLFTPFYDLVVTQGGLGKSLQEKVLQYAQIKDGESILDIGCGSGTFVTMAKSTYSNSRVVGIDPDENILTVAKKKLSKNNLRVELFDAWAEKLPFDTQSFDIIVSSLTFHHLPTEIKEKALKEIKRVLKKHGRFILADIGKPDSLFWRIKFLLDPERLFKTGEYMKDNLEGRIPALLSQAGFMYKEILPRYQSIQFFLTQKI